MTSTVAVTANPKNDVVLLHQDRHPELGWVDSYSQFLAAGTSYTYYVWNDRRVIVEEVTSATLQRAQQEN
jgi:hypothetical protein